VRFFNVKKSEVFVCKEFVISKGDNHPDLSIYLYLCHHERLLFGVNFIADDAIHGAKELIRIAYDTLM